MKLLLTSAGLRNDSIINALKELVDKPFNELKFVFVPTAANVEPGEKDITFYAIDDNTAIKVVDGNIEIISEGEWKKFN